jgi:hypothetical protein
MNTTQKNEKGKKQKKAKKTDHRWASLTQNLTS